MVPPALPAPQYHSGPLPLLQQLHALCPGSPSHPWVSSPINQHPGAGDILKLEGSGCLGMGRIVPLMLWLGQSAADSFVGLGSFLQELVCVGEGAARW